MPALFSVPKLCSKPPPPLNVLRGRALQWEDMSIDVREMAQVENQPATKGIHQRKSSLRTPTVNSSKVVVSFSGGQGHIFIWLGCGPKEPPVLDDHTCQKDQTRKSKPLKG